MEAQTIMAISFLAMHFQNNIPRMSTKKEKVESRRGSCHEVGMYIGCIYKSNNIPEKYRNGGRGLSGIVKSRHTTR